MKKTCNITWQEKDDFLSDFIDSGFVSYQPIRIAHAVNLYSKPGASVSESSDSNESEISSIETLQLPDEQLSMIESMRISADSCWKTCGVRPDFLGITSREDSYLLPSDFYQLLLSQPQSLAEETPTHRCTTPTPLPRLFDLLNSIKYCASDATHIVFTNSDIHLQPWFYEVCELFLRSGYDSLIINRRTIESYPRELAAGVSAALLLAESGTTHPGMDCFVFPSIWLKQFLETDAIIGRGAVMRSLLFNMVAIAQSLLVITHAQMTYHFGDDRPWLFPAAHAARSHNKAQAAQLWLRLVQTDYARRNLLELGNLFSQYLPELPSDTLNKFLKPENL